MRPCKLLPLLSIIFLSCTENGEQGKAAVIRITEATPTTDTAETFAMFNERYHLDSMFQLSRTAFPIGGRFVEGETSKEWTAKNWELLKEPVKETVDSNEYKYDIQMNDSSVTEKYWFENSGFKVERRFKKIAGKWFLVYYDDVSI